MDGFSKKIAILWTIFIFCLNSVDSIDPATFKEDIAIKLNLKDESITQKYYGSLKEYINYILKSIYSLKETADEATDLINTHYNELMKAYWFLCIQGYFVSGIPQPINEIAYDIKDSEAVGDAKNFIISYIWNPIQNITITDIEERLRNFINNLYESEAFRKPHKYLGQFILDTFKRLTVKLCCCRDEIQMRELFCKQGWFGMPFLRNFLWFVIGFGTCFFAMYVYNYVKELREQFDSYDEYLDSVREQEYPLDEKDKQDDMHSNNISDTEDTEVEK